MEISATRRSEREGPFADGVSSNTGNGKVSTCCLSASGISDSRAICLFPRNFLIAVLQKLHTASACAGQPKLLRKATVFRYFRDQRAKFIETRVDKISCVKLGD